MVLEVDSNNVVEEEVQSPLSLKLNDSSSKIGGTQTMRPQNHSELEDLLLMDCETANRFSPNGTPEPFESECCVGVVLPMIRTSNKTKGNTRNEKVYDYFRSKKRGFEFQFQLKLKKIPEGDFYISCQLSEPLQLNIIKRALAGAILKFVKTLNRDFYYSLEKEGKEKSPHLSFLAESSFDRIVVTKPGEVAPKLGCEIYEDPDSIKARKNGTKIEFNTQDTYTFSLWSAYIDFCQWKYQNIPAIPSLSLSSIIGTQYFSLTWYCLASSDRKQFYQSNMKTMMSFEFGHCKKTSYGPTARKWIQKYQTACTHLPCIFSLAKNADRESEDRKGRKDAETDSESDFE